MEQFVDDAHRERLHGLALCGREVREFRLEPLVLRLPDALGLGAQGRHQRCGQTGGHVEHVTLDLLTDDLANTLGFAGTLLQTTLGPCT
ncbi:unannotated protein [freshwater metagenome]|uniref:Unannotated protein n=1 Tax=freshwater metagenome TaxID=449393 RepID=A0A6J6SGS0_9ZZZZ